MRPIGYLYKRVHSPPESFGVPQVVDIYSLSPCLSEDFGDYVGYWQHNGFYLFDSAAAIRSLAARHSISLEGSKLFFYEAHELQFEEGSGQWVPFQPEASIETHVQLPATSVLEGFDVCTFSSGTRPECSPLSCNGLAQVLATNAHCLFPTFESAVHALEDGELENSEP